MNKALTILYVHSSDEMYGADLILLQLVERLDPKQFKPIVVLPNDVPYQGLLGQALRERNIKVVHLNLAVLRRKYFSLMGFPLYIWRLITSTCFLIQLIHREKVAIVHSNTVAVMPGAFAAFITHTPHIWHVHEIIVNPRFLWRLTSWLLPRLSERVVTVSESVRAHICAGNRLNDDKAIVIYNGIDLTRFNDKISDGEKIRVEWGVKPSQTLIGMIGRISGWKGQDYFLEAANLVVKIKPKVHFVLVGGIFPGQEFLLDGLRDMVNKYRLNDLVTLSDYRLDIPAVLNAFDIFVLPSTLPDPFPTVVLEAMAAGKPIVANAHGGSVEMIEHQVTGLLVKPGQINEMALSIAYLIENPSKRKDMGECGRKRLMDKFSLESFVQNWVNLYLMVSKREDIS